jgi:hypothetical protein
MYLEQPIELLLVYIALKAAGLFAESVFLMAPKPFF